MQIKPIIFNSDMVRALLEGRKTQMRRPVKLPIKFDGWDVTNTVLANRLDAGEACPYGKPGDLIYVRETFAWLHDDGGEPVSPDQFLYAASDSWEGCKVPSCQMPRRASRLTLKVTSVRVERVQDITEQDAKSEGCVAIEGFKWHTFEERDAGIPMREHTAKDHFEAIWESIYGESWSRNDWVWVIEFEVIRQNVDEYLAGLK